MITPVNGLTRTYNRTDFYKKNSIVKNNIDSQQTRFLLPNYTCPIVFKGKTSPLQNSLTNLFEKYSNGILFNEVKPEFIERFTKKLESKPFETLKIGITGEAGCGKSTFVDRIIERLSKKHGVIPCQIRRDEYLKDYSAKIKEYGSYNIYSLTGEMEGSECVDFDRIISDMTQLCEGKTIFPKKRDRASGVVLDYDFEKPMKPSSVILMEVISLFHNKNFKEFLDVSIYAECPEKVIRKRWGQRSPSRGKTGEIARICYHLTKEKANIYTIPYKKDSDLVLNTMTERKVLNNFIDDLMNIISQGRL